MRQSLIIGFLAFSSAFALVSQAQAGSESWITMKDYEGVRLSFNPMKDDLKHPPIKMVVNETNTPYVIQNPDISKHSPNDQKYLYLFKNVIQDDASRCVFYDDVVMNAQDEYFPGTSDLYAAREWEFNRFEYVPTYWKKPGYFPLSFSIKANGRVVKVLCSTKDHMLNKGTELANQLAKTAYASYAKLLSSFGVSVTMKDGTFFAAAKPEVPKTDDAKKSKETKPAVETKSEDGKQAQEKTEVKVDEKAEENKSKTGAKKKAPCKDLFVTDKSKQPQVNGEAVTIVRKAAAKGAAQN